MDIWLFVILITYTALTIGVLKKSEKENKALREKNASYIMKRKALQTEKDRLCYMNDNLKDELSLKEKQIEALSNELMNAESDRGLLIKRVEELKAEVYELSVKAGEKEE